jgi:Iron-containing redox enzyme
VTIAPVPSDRVAAAPVLPEPRGPLSDWLVHQLPRPAPGPHPAPPACAPTDPLCDEDLQLSLYAIYELSYRGFVGVEDEWEREPNLLGVRRSLEDQFEAALRQRVADRGWTTDARTVGEVLGRFHGPSLSEHMARMGTVDQFREFSVHRSGYQLKEADPHSWVIPRISGARKAALIEIQTDEYGGGRPGEAHAELFADALAALGLDATYGAHIDRLPGVTLAAGNLISLLGTQQRLRAALLGHLAGFEMTSVKPMTRYAAATLRLGLDPRVTRFFTVHVDADEHHGALAADVLVGGDPDREGLPTREITFGVGALLLTEDAFTRHLLHCWSQGETSLRRHLQPARTP